MLTLFTKTLDKNRQDVYQKLSFFSDTFVLAGGTAIMLQINHRKSYDFDCFSVKPLSNNLLRSVKKVYGDTINVQIDTSDLLLLTTSRGIKVDFVYFPYLPIEKILETKPISILSLNDLAANKAYTIGRRATWRDYVDMFFLVKNDNLNSIIVNANNKIKGEFNEKLFLEQLVYFKDLDIVPIDFIHKTYTNKEIKDFLRKEVQKYTSFKINVGE